MYSLMSVCVFYLISFSLFYPVGCLFDNYYSRAQGLKRIFAAATNKLKGKENVKRLHSVSHFLAVFLPLCFFRKQRIGIVLEFRATESLGLVLFLLYFSCTS